MEDNARLPCACVGELLLPAAGAQGTIGSTQTVKLQSQFGPTMARLLYKKRYSLEKRKL